MPHKANPEGFLSVTEVLSLTIDKPFLRYWFGKHGTEKCSQIQRESQELGIDVHRCIEDRFNNNNNHNYLDRSYKMVDNFWNKFVTPYEVKPVELEVTRQDTKLKLQGTVDGVLDTNKWENVTTDYKTSNQLDKVSLPLQLSMYDYLRKGDGKGCGVRIDKESNAVQVVWYDNLKVYVPVWKAALRLARYIKFGEV